MLSLDGNRETLLNFDAFMMATHCQAVNCRPLPDWSSGIVDARNVLAGVKVITRQVWNI